MGRNAGQLDGAFLSRNGRRLWVEYVGKGPAVVFAHAGVADRRMWDDPFAELAGCYHVVRYDQPGYGRSDAASERYSPVEDLDAILNHVRAEQAALVGCSMGGAIIVDYTLAHPGRNRADGSVVARPSTGSRTAERDRRPYPRGGGDDDVPDFVRVAELLAGEIAGAQLVVMPGVDHNVPVRAGRVLTELLATFLDGLDLWP